MKHLYMLIFILFLLGLGCSRSNNETVGEAEASSSSNSNNNNKPAETPDPDPGLSEDVKLRVAVIKEDIKMSQESSPSDLRKYLSEEYKFFVEKTYPNYNFIKVSVTKTKKGYGLWAHHPFFSEYSFSAGDDPDKFKDWATLHSVSFKKAQITQYGITGPSGRSGFTITGN